MSRPRAAVASGHPATTEAALTLLRAGGNAADAAIAAGFAACVSEPGLTSLGGGGFLLHRKASGRASLYDFFTDTPGLEREHGGPEDDSFEPVVVRFSGGDQVFNVGAASCAVPGVLRGYLDTHEALGQLPLAEVLAPAIGLAVDGVVVNAEQAHFFELLEPILTRTAAGRAIYAPSGRYLAQGDRFRNPDFAAFLCELPRDRGRELHHGGLAQRLVRELDEAGGHLTTADLAAYRAREREPLEIDYRDCRVLSNGPPSRGGRLIAAGLRALEGRGPEPQDEVGEVLRRLDAMQAMDRVRGDLECPTFPRGTTHVSVVDAHGDAAALTTSNGEGSGVIVPGTGIMLNNMMGEDDLHPEGFFASPPGQRIGSMMSPTLVLRAGQTAFVLGSGGSKRIRTAILQVLLDVIDLTLPLAEAVERPRMHLDEGRLQVEPGFGDAALEVLEARLPVTRWPRRDVFFGGVHAVSLAGEAVGDPRRGGSPGWV